jgi:ubiquinone/menaquinone biosynthesis C-methylase UbiE
VNTVKHYYEKEAVEYDRQFYKEPDSYPILKYRHNYILKRIEQLKLPDCINVLDVGCGPGEMILDLSRHNWNIWGIDIANNMIELAKEKTKKSNSKIHLSVGDIEKLEFFDNFFDLIICAGVVEYLNDDRKWLKEIVRVLKPGGVLIINITNKYSIKNWSAAIIERMKRNKTLFSVMEFVKRKILKKGKLHYFPFRPRLHSPNKFDKLLNKNGFQKLSHNYFSFSILPAPFDTLFGFITIPIRRYMERYSERKMILNGTGYIVCAKLKK